MHLRWLKPPGSPASLENFKNLSIFRGAVTRFRTCHEDTHCAQQEVLDECVQRIYGGTNEIMKELISRAL
jgi:hypothetical protein